MKVILIASILSISFLSVACNKVSKEKQMETEADEILDELIDQQPKKESNSTTTEEKQTDSSSIQH